MNTARYALPISIAALLLSGCQSEEITSLTIQGDLTIREARATATGYTPREIGPLPGDTESLAHDITNSGYVLVVSNNFMATEPYRATWFIRAGTKDVMLPDGEPSDLSSGATTYLGGTTSTDGISLQPTIWTFNPSTGFSAPVVRDHPPGQGGRIEAVGDAGQAVGSAVDGGAIWKADGTRIDVANVDPAVFEAVYPRDINNTDDAVFEMWDSDRKNRAYLRTSDGTMIMLPPLPGHVASRGSAVSEIVNGVLYVAGTSDDGQGEYRAVRWVVDVAAHAVTATHARPDRSGSTGIADDGTVIGYISSGGSTPFVWRMNNTTVTLKAPKGLNAPSVSAISGNGRYIAGVAKSGGTYNRAVYWVAQQ